MPKLLQANYSRKYHRVQLPAQVIVEGEECEVVDWSLGGFKCVLPKAGLQAEWSDNITFVLPLPDMNISFSTAVVLRYVGGGYAGFEFSELSENNKAIMQKYFQATVEGKVDDAQGVVASIESAVVPFKADLEMTDEECAEFQKTYKKRASAHALAGLSIVLIVLGVVYSNWVTAVSVDAAVYEMVVRAAPEQSGIIKNIAVQKGQVVKKGQLLYSMDDEKGRRDVEQSRIALAMAQQQLAMMRIQLTDEHKAMRLYRDAAKQKVGMLRHKFEAAKSTRQLAEKELERAKMLVKRGAVSRSYTDKRRQAYLTTKAEEDRLHEELRHARVNAVSAATGKYLTDGAVRGEVEKIRAEISVQEHKVALHKVQLAQAVENLKRFHVKSMAAGRVHAVKQAQGSFVTTGQSVLTLVPADAVPWVVARFTFEDAKRLAVGDEAELIIPSLKKKVKGIVDTVGDNAVIRDDLAFKNLTKEPQVVPVKILFTDAVAPALGARAEVRVTTSWF
ncbi:biotin/lipoyl-binding protein [Halodesulfovibrio spirochaetisodalis]|uniref:Membrane fusion protein biotin-lipoyl like domain-containing protein n=1 Tax=Halodesulfovibrio spirochaetisodalis TaxID=1560234 RepID=A0A1B7XI27_9BACT|nr:biotin/lipoyl-binding protein [Halodesulfovibrio spirochaetisodalis]OBQ55163.1 hypothetical protein SP90_04085 [Halodesulfovibrio spirochaetisodalis]